MITSFVLTISILISNFAVGTKAQFNDMSDEDFEKFADLHADVLYEVSDATVHIAEKYHVLLERGVIGTATGMAIKVMSGQSFAASLLVGGGIEVAKGIYTDLMSSSSHPDSKEEQLKEMSKQIEFLLKEVNELKMTVNGNLMPTAGDFSSGHGHETRDKNTNNRDVRSSVYSLAGRTFTTDSREAGPHRDSYREYRDSSTREIRDTIDRITHDATRDKSNDNYVERRRDS